MPPIRPLVGVTLQVRAARRPWLARYVGQAGHIIGYEPCGIDVAFDRVRLAFLDGGEGVFERGDLIGWGGEARVLGVRHG